MILWMLIASIAINLTGILFYLFIFWKKLKDEFSSEVLFKIAFGSLIGVLVGAFFAYILKLNWYFWFGLIGGLVGMFIKSYRFKSKIYEIAEAFIISILPWTAFLFLYDSVIHTSLVSFIGFLAILTLIFIFYLLALNYKKFIWYKSGKIGFSGLTILAIIFIIRLILALTKIGMLSLVGSIFEPILSGLGVLICLILVVRLSKLK